ncbi:MAG: hypothetical protein HRT93_03360 [Piscirickettsiaceae bacterium]|nr:hypothetical protein [Piscirickettsiaceae bacterium]
MSDTIFTEEEMAEEEAIGKVMDLIAINTRLLTENKKLKRAKAMTDVKIEALTLANDKYKAALKKMKGRVVDNG